MPVRYSIDPERALVHTIYSGDVTDADLREHLRALRADPRFDSHMKELVDLSDVKEASATSAAVRESARWLLHDVRARRAVVAPTDVLFGLARMYQASRPHTDDDQLAVFRTLPSALDWLGVADVSQPAAPAR